MTYSYPVHLNIQYSNNNEYRDCIRQVFQMNARNFPDTSMLELDDETQDEMMYDDKSANDMMDFIYERTKLKDEFIDLYSKAASFMFSIDTNIGLTIDDPLLNKMSRGVVQNELDRFQKPNNMGTVYITSNGDENSKVKAKKEGKN